jgi:hypothetical protein
VLNEYIVEPATVPWRQGQVGDVTFMCQVLLSGADGGPEALHFRFDPSPSVFAHMHLTSQFQLLLQGRMDFPKSTMKLRGVAVHYTDHNFPYGPFAVADDHDMLVLHPKQGGLITMADRDARRQINLKGRHLYGAASDTQWTHLPELGGTVRCKALIAPAMQLTAPDSELYAVMIECLPNASIDLPGAHYGRYEVVIGGSASVSGRTLVPPGFRYVCDDRRLTPLKAGPEGATVMILAFDQDALEGGLTGEGLSVAAAAAMERAI